MEKSHAPNDYMVSLLEIWSKVDNFYDSSLSETRALCKGYVDGLNQYMRENMDKVLPGVYPVNEKDLIAGFVHKTPLFFGVHNVLADMLNKRPEDFNEKKDLEKIVKKAQLYTKGSNVFALNRSDAGIIKFVLQ